MVFYIGVLKDIGIKKSNFVAKTQFLSRRIMQFADVATDKSQKYFGELFRNRSTSGN